VANTSHTSTAPIIIKKYANRRLYNTQTSSYVTLDVLSQMVKDGVEFTVHDAKSGEDITRSVLTQIIFEEESKGANLLPINFLRKLIGYYGDRLETLVPRYLEMSMESFASNQDQIREQLSSSFDPSNTFKQFEAITQQNLSMFEQAVRMFSPFEGGPQSDGQGAAEASGSGTNRPDSDSGNSEPESRGDELAVLKEQLQNMQSQLNALAQKKT
jgi:polyhydroxyalkanoate synthesis repressor PhaR